MNAWIRGSGVFDAVVDFDAAVRDPADPQRMLARYDSGDHLHPNDAGFQAMADAVDLRTLGRPGPVRPAPYHRPGRSLSVAAAPEEAVTIAGQASSVSFVSRTTVQGPGTVRGTVTATLGGTEHRRPFTVRSNGRFAQADVAHDIPVPAALEAGEHRVLFTVRTRDGRRQTATALLDVRRLGCGPSGDACPLDLTGAYDRDSIASAARPDDGDFDGLGWSYAAETVPAAGPSVLAGAPFVFPSSADGARNTVTARGQTLDLPAVRVRHLRVLGAASGGAAEAVGAITYTDGTTAPCPCGSATGPAAARSPARTSPWRRRTGTAPAPAAMDPPSPSTHAPSPRTRTGRSARSRCRTTRS
ncbi:hypothetical protein GCM10020295_02700 [Streptomyces cinereospinus]